MYLRDTASYGRLPVGQIYTVLYTAVLPHLLSPRDVVYYSYLATLSGFGIFPVVWDPASIHQDCQTVIKQNYLFY